MRDHQRHSPGNTKATPNLLKTLGHMNRRGGISSRIREVRKKYGLHLPVSVVFVEDEFLDVGPKFLKGIARQESTEAFRGTQQCIVRIRFAVNAPGV